MHSSNTDNPVCTQEAALDLFSREAKKLHKASQSKLSSKALPVLRRLIKSQTFREISLVQLFQRQAIVQRKHIFQMLALEAGYKNWAEFKYALSALPAHELTHYCHYLLNAGYPNHWFSSLPEAQAFASEHGGSALSFGTQALVIPADYAVGNLSSC
ncbi:hypothetical protein [Agaribacterium haliotis]|uniref:hypothetical protein n=1 Tax=Agaribacterium haliotis TaxID=2013869 RepID=UPI000BB531EF|nr:hypothetical protein [Agaribacterium haliotis]